MTPGKTAALAIALLIGIAVAHVWVISGGCWWHWRLNTAFYCQLAEGFMHGHLSLPETPPAKLLALRDPYDPYLNNGIRRHDAVLFEGKYYVYWGPVPALLAVPLCLWTGTMHPSFGDQRFVFVFTFGVVVLTTIFLLLIQRRAFPNERFAGVAAGVLSLGMGGPLLFALVRPAVYEAAIMGGQFFLIAGLLAAWVGLSQNGRRSGPFVLAGVCWMLSVGSRISLAPAIGIIALLTVAQVWRSNRRALNACVAGIFTPLLIGAALFAWYNYARFHSITELGLHYQLAGANQHSMPAADFSAPRFIVPNLLNYLLSAPGQEKKFPYLYADTPRWTAAMFHLGIKYRIEPLVGLAWTQPLLILSLMALPWRQRDGLSGRLCWSLWIAVILGFLPPLMMNGGTMRYLMDMVPCCTILAAIGLMQLLTFAGQKAGLRNWIEALVGVLVVAQCAVGLMLVINR